MNLRRAALFVSVVDHGGFTAAARALGLPKSALSTAVSALEDELGVRLMTRTSRKVAVTEAGALLHGRASPALAALEEAASEVIDGQASLAGPIRMTAPVEVGTRLLEPLLSRFLLLHPEVSVDVMLTPRVVDLAEEAIDLAVRGGPIAGESLIARKLALEDAGLFAAPAYLAEHGRPRVVADLSRHAGVLYRAVGGRSTWTLTGPKGVETVEVSARVSADHFAYIVRAVANGVGVGLLPFFLCKDEVARGELVRVLPRFALEGTPLNLVYPSRRYLPRRVAALRDFLLDGLLPTQSRRSATSRGRVDAQPLMGNAPHA